MKGTEEGKGDDLTFEAELDEAEKAFKLERELEEEDEEADPQEKAPRRKRSKAAKAKAKPKAKASTARGHDKATEPQKEENKGDEKKRKNVTEEDQ